MKITFQLKKTELVGGGMLIYLIAAMYSKITYLMGGSMIVTQIISFLLSVYIDRNSFTSALFTMILSILVIAVFIVFVCLILGIILCITSNKSICILHSLILNDGILQIEEHGEITGMELCQDMKVFTIYKLTILRYKVEKLETMHRFIPDRAFRGTEEKLFFINHIKNSTKTRIEYSDKEDADYGFHLHKNASYYADVSLYSKLIANQLFKFNIKQFVFIGPIFIVVIFQILNKNSDSSLFDNIITMVLTITLFCTIYSHVQNTNYSSQIFNRRFENDTINHEKIFMDKQSISCYQDTRQFKIKWDLMKSIVKSDKYLTLTLKKIFDGGIYIPRRMFPNKEQEEDFIQYCVERGMEYREVKRKFPDKVKISSGSSMKALMIKIVVIMFIFCFIIFVKAFIL